jgi:hypothetical protein
MANRHLPFTALPIEHQIMTEDAMNRVTRCCSTERGRNLRSVVLNWLKTSVTVHLMLNSTLLCVFALYSRTALCLPDDKAFAAQHHVEVACSWPEMEI